MQKVEIMKSNYKLWHCTYIWQLIPRSPQTDGIRRLNTSISQYLISVEPAYPSSLHYLADISYAEVTQLSAHKKLNYTYQDNTSLSGMYRSTVVTFIGCLTSVVVL
jgi:hypothetical protein